MPIKRKANLNRKDLKKYRNPLKRIEDNRKYQRKHYRKNKEYYIKKARERRIKTVEFLRDLKEERGCKNCGLKDKRCLDFHHKKGGKKYGITMMICQGFAMKEIIEEISKCEVLCRNCHAIVHYKERGLVKL